MKIQKFFDGIVTDVRAYFTGHDGDLFLTQDGDIIIFTNDSARELAKWILEVTEPAKLPPNEEVL